MAGLVPAIHDLRAAHFPRRRRTRPADAVFMDRRDKPDDDDPGFD
jgi:hypothetical protein